MASRNSSRLCIQTYFNSPCSIWIVILNLNGFIDCNWISLGAQRGRITHCSIWNLYYCKCKWTSISVWGLKDSKYIFCWGIGWIRGLKRCWRYIFVIVVVRAYIDLLLPHYVTPSDLISYIGNHVWLVLWSRTCCIWVTKSHHCWLIWSTSHE